MSQGDDDSVSSKIAKSFSPHPTALQEREQFKLIKATQEGSTKQITEILTKDLRAKILPEISRCMTEECDDHYPKGIKKPSVLRKPTNTKTLEFLSELKWEEICQEAFTLFPLLVCMMVSIMLPKEKWTSTIAIRNILPRLGMVYAILIQTRIPQLSRVQRVVTALLADSICETKVTYAA